MPHMLFQVHPVYMPSKTIERYVPRIFGFKVHDIAEQHRWQDEAREMYEERRKLLKLSGDGKSGASTSNSFTPVTLRNEQAI